MEGFFFEKLAEQNFENLYLLFDGHASPFVDELFKTYEGAKEYTKFIETCGAYSAKHGGQDWLFKMNNEYVGILHLYDLSLETFGQNNKRAWVGVATAEKFRNQGVTFLAFNYFIQYIFENYPIIDFIHSMTLHENKPAANFLKRCGFVVDNTERHSKDHLFLVRRKLGLS